MLSKDYRERREERSGEVSADRRQREKVVTLKKGRGQGEIKENRSVLPTDGRRREVCV